MSLRSPMVIQFKRYHAIINRPNTMYDRDILVDLEDLPIMVMQSWTCDNEGYVKNAQLKTLHRILLEANGDDIVDHINGNPSDNRRKNLRICTKGQNNINSVIRPSNKSGYRGVYKSSDPRVKHKLWIASIGVCGKKISLGRFDNPKDAAIAYNNAAIKYHGEFAMLNIIN